MIVSMLRFNRAHLLIIALAFSPALAHAQAPAERASIDSIRAVYAAVSDSGYLISHERELIQLARVDRDNVLRHFELGFLAYRLGELTGTKKRYNDAASEFQWATDLRPQWAFAWYELGMANLLSGESSVILVENIRQMMGMDALSQAARAFAKAVEIDPAFSEALVNLAAAAMRQRLSPRLAVAQSALRQAAATDAGRVPEVQLLRGKVERRLGDYDSAVVAFRRYVVVGGDSALGFVEVARSQALLGRSDSAMNTYFAAIARPLSDTVRMEVRKDLRWFATPAELVEFDHTPRDSAGLWLRRFWVGRDLDDGRRIGERINEQFRRYQYAVNHFGLVSKRRGFDVAFAYSDTTQQEFDDRGVIYLRHGEPYRRTQFSGSGYEPNESWLYRRDPPAGDMIVHFAAFNDVQDFRLVQSLLSVCTRRYSADPLDPGVNASVAQWRDCVQSRSELSPEYERLARQTDAASANAWATERSAVLAMVHEATTTDSYVLQFEQEMQPIVSLFAVADTRMRPELHLVFAVPAERLHAEGEDGAYTYPLALRMLVFDSATHRLIASLDTVRVFRSRARLREGSYLTEQLVMRVPSGRFKYSFVIQEVEGHSGDVVSNHTIEIPALDLPFTASDIVVGREGSGLVWRRQEGEVQLNPLMRFPRDGEATIFYELYGLPQGAEVTTHVRITKQGGRGLLHRVFGGGGGTDLSYTTVTDAAPRSRVNQTLSLRGLSPGRYRLEVEFTDPVSGARITRESPFEIEGARAS
jgi:GWxTD domain-containing protein